MFDQPTIGLVADTLTKRHALKLHDTDHAPDKHAASTPDLTRYREVDLSLDRDMQALWCFLKPAGPPSFTSSLLRELNLVHRQIHQMYEERVAGDPDPVKFYVVGSALPGIFNLGGDLAFFLKCIRNNDAISLRNYAYACVEAMYNNAFGFSVPVVSVGILEGDALGGGLEAALSFNILIAERGVKMGFPEVLFNSFPGMGAYSFLSRKLDHKRAEKIILSGQIYTAEEFYEMGIVDILVEPGQGRDTAHQFVVDNMKRQSLLYSATRVRQCVNPLTLTELRNITDIWVDTSMALQPSELRKMEVLIHAQSRKINRKSFVLPDAI